MTDRSRFGRRAAVAVAVLGIPLLVTAAYVASGARGPAEGVQILQAGKVFNPSTIKVEVGQKVEFVNQDPFVHNLYSDSPGYNFDLGAQKSKDILFYVFDKPGHVEMYCHIHPEMKLVVEVMEKAP